VQASRVSVDDGSGGGDDGDMSTPTREEFEARLETVEARMDGRVARIEGKIDAFMAQALERDKRLDERDKRIELLAESAARSAERASNLKTNFWGAVVTIILSVTAIAVSTYYATQSSNLAIVQTTLAAFQQGQATPPKR
jgi:tetrahydromethanopterin S-methyltransferase subunit G